MEKRIYLPDHVALKSLNMSMLRHFFEIGTDPALFEGLYISENPALCEEYMGKFPVVSISLKGINSSSFDGACRLLNKVINEECRRLGFLEESQNLTENEKVFFANYLKVIWLKIHWFTA